MNKSYAIGFLIVLLVIVLGLYIAFTSFTSSREAQRAQSASLSSSNASQPADTPAEPSPTTTPTTFVIPTPMPGITATLTAIASAPETEPPPPTDTPVPTVQPPTPIPAPAYQFRLAGPPVADPNYQLCCYIYGTVRDAAGNPLEGVQVQAFNEWNTLQPALTKGGGEVGQYNIPIGAEVVAWYLMVVDAGGNQISSQVQVPFDPNVAKGFRVDWQRAY
jgi:hypothetical protein